MRKRILFVGHIYYSNWYLSRELRKIGWKADVVNIDEDLSSQLYFHGEDYTFDSRTVKGKIWQLLFYITSLFRYDIFHFSNAEGMIFGWTVHRLFSVIFGKGSEIKFLKLIGKKIVYTNNGCRDGVLQSSFSKWGNFSICSICPWKDDLNVCSDDKNKEWGEFRNKYADYQCLLGGNRKDYNIGETIKESPWAYSLSKDFWDPNILIPSNYLLPLKDSTIKLYHAVGNFDSRSKNNKTIKSTEVYLNLVDKMKREGFDVELIFFKDVDSKKIKYYQMQADIVVDMLTYGWFGSNVREALMLGKVVVCNLRTEWLDSAREELPDFIDELPIINANPDNVYSVIKELILNKYERLRIGEKSREFAVKWFGSENSAKRADIIYSNLLSFNKKRN